MFNMTVNLILNRTERILDFFLQFPQQLLYIETFTSQFDS